MDYNYAALRTLGGAIDYTVRRYGRIATDSRDWEILASHLQVSKDTAPVVELVDGGFVLEAEGKRMMYRHHDENHKRTVMLSNQ